MKTEILDRIKATSSSNEKIQIAIDNFDDELHMFMESCFNGRLYGLSGARINKALRYEKKVHGKFEDIGDFVETMFEVCPEHFSYIYPLIDNYSLHEFLTIIPKYSGNRQIERFQYLLGGVKKEEWSWFVRALQKNPRIGMSLTNYNKVRIAHNKPVIKNFYVKLCSRVEPENFDKLNYPLFAEIKYDGERCIATYHCGKISLRSRGNKDITSQYPEIVEQIKLNLQGCEHKKFKFDGEIVSSDFNALQKRMGRKEENIEKDESLRYVIYDMLLDDDEDMKELPQSTRRRFMNCIISQAHSSTCLKIDTPCVLKSFYDEAVKKGEEGIVIKHLDAKWTDDRDDWFKVKPVYTADLRIVKADFGNGKNTKYINILHLESVDEKVKCKCSSGMTDDYRKLFTKRYNDGRLIGKIVEVKYNELTPVRKDGTVSIRHPRFIKVRDDKDIPDDYNKLL